MEVVPVSLATNGDYDDDLGHGYLRRPISVAQLLEREGYRPAARSRATRRALTGVAAGAVLALGAVVGSLLLNHASGNTAGDTLASGSKIGDVVLSNGAHQQAIAPSPKTDQAGQVGSAAVADTTQPQIVQNGGQAATKPVTRLSTVPAQTGRTTAATPVTPNTTQSTPATSGTSTTPAAPSGSTPAPSTSTSPPPSTPTTQAPPASSSGSSSGGGGLLGTVTGTLTGTLNSVTQPVFSWFGG
jgi:hypothetical protein